MSLARNKRKNGRFKTARPQRFSFKAHPPVPKEPFEFNKVLPREEQGYKAGHSNQPL
jgi:hypothetical protein